MANSQLTLERERTGRLAGLGVRFFLSAALTAGQTAGGSAPFALGWITAAGPGLEGAAALAGAFAGAALFLPFRNALPFLAVAVLITAASASLGVQVVEYAKQFLGRPYVWGGNGPNSFDCSGFTKYVYAHFGYTLNRTASAQLSNGVSVSRSELQPGDLVFFYNGRVSTPVSHVGIYVGDGQFIHASTNTYAVQYDSLYSNHYNNTYVYARRIF